MHRWVVLLATQRLAETTLAQLRPGDTKAAREYRSAIQLAEDVGINTLNYEDVFSTPVAVFEKEDTLPVVKPG